MRTSKMKKMIVASAALCSILMTKVASADQEVEAVVDEAPMSAELMPGARAGIQIQCESWNHQLNRCYVGGQIRDVRIYRQLSSNNDGACNRGYSWGFDQNSIWVDRGCRAIFQVGVNGPGGNPGNPGYPGYPGNPPGNPGYPGNPPGNPGYPEVYRIRCSSWGNQSQRCEMGRYIERVNLLRLLPGSSACIRSQTWGHDSTGLWVTSGCSAEFDVYVR
jgi:hypothetical protein